jgi:NADH-quinone oxidoreductase subunit N
MFQNINFTSFNYNYIKIKDISFIFNEVLISFFILYLIVLGIYISKKKYQFQIIPQISRIVTVLFVFSLLLSYNLPNIAETLFDNMLITDSFLKFNKIFLTSIFILGTLISPVYLKFFKINRYEFFVFILVVFLGSSVLLMSNDFLVFYLALELQSLTFYLLASLKKNSPFSVEAGLKYFMLGAISSGFLLFGVVLIYGLTGTINFFNLSLLLIGLDVNSYFLAYPIIFGIFLVFTFFFFKLAAAPFHIWSPDVYEGSPLVSVLYMAVIPKFVFFLVLSRLIFFVFYEVFLIFDYYFTFVIILSFIFSIFNALQQKKFKRFFAYSSISHVGFMLMALNSLSVIGYVSFYFYLYVYTLMNLFVWCLLIVLKNPFKNGLHSFILNLANLSKVNFALSFSFFILLMSMAGIPPFIGFFSKFWVFLSALQSKQYFCLFFAIFSSIFSTYYYLRVVKIIFFEDSKYIPNIAPISKTASYVISFLTISLILLFFFSDYFYTFIYYYYLKTFYLIP